MILVILSTLLAGTLSTPSQSIRVNDDGSYQFFFDTGKDGGFHSRSEVRHPDGVVVGKYSYEDANGEIREVKYRADDKGYVANGDVSVEGAPKGQFPAASEVQEQQSSPDEAVKHEDFTDDEDLSLDDSTSDNPPEAFPQGYFLQNFQGLRRLPEPTKDSTVGTSPPDRTLEVAAATTPEPATTEKTTDAPVPSHGQSSEDQKNEISNLKIGDVPDSLRKLQINQRGALLNLRHFRNISPREWASSMLYQPVHVLTYQHPESYGYYYYY